MDKYNFNEFSLLKGQRFACLNIRSLYANHSSLELDLRETDISALGLVETWLKPHLPTGIFKIDGFNLARLDRSGPKRGGGLGCYIRADLNWEYDQDIPNSSLSNTDIEFLTIKILRRMQQPILITLIYVPPSTPTYKALEYLDSLGDKITTTKLDWILMGDFNVNLLDNNSNTTKVNRFAQCNCLYQLVKTPTRITPVNQSLLDHIYSNINPEYTRAYVIKYGLSDHDMIGLVIKKPTIKMEHESFTCRTNQYYSIDILQTAIDSCIWTEFEEMPSVEIGWEILYNNYLRALNIAAPLVTLNNVQKRKSWTTPELLRQIRLRDRLKSASDSLLNNTAFANFKKTRNKIKRDIIKAKRDFVMSKINTNRSSPRKYWKELKEVFDPKDTGIPELALLKENGTEVRKESTADYMNEYFSNVGHNLASKIRSDNTPYLALLRDTALNNRNKLITWRLTNPEELKLLISKIDISKSSKIYNISSRYFKDCLICSIDKVCLLFNRILTDAKFPAQWKEANIIPIFKKGNRKLVKNYRPISLLPIIGKLMEKLIHSRIYHFLNGAKFFSPYQGGFRPEMGTTDSISNMLSYIYNQLNNNTVTATIFFDLSKAFDSIDQNILLQKLESAGISGNCLRLLKDYLSNRTQTCTVNNITLSSKPMYYGVPQGSTLGPLLFIIFINDLATQISNVKLSLYADDTAFYLGGTDKSHIINELNIAANAFDKWCSYNRLTLNYDKTKSMLFTPSQNNKHTLGFPDLEIDNKPIDRVTEFKYLGTILDQNLNFESHIKMIRQNVVARMHILKKVRWALTPKDALTLFKSSILPYFDQGDVFYSCANKSTLHNLQTLQNKILRTIFTKKHWEGTHHAHVKNKLLYLNQRRKASLQKYVHSLSYVVTNLKTPISRNLRSTGKVLLKTVRAKTKKYERLFVHQSALLWNDLSEDMKSIRNFKLFKTRVKCELLLNNINFPE